MAPMGKEQLFEGSLCRSYDCLLHAMSLKCGVIPSIFKQKVASVVPWCCRVTVVLHGSGNIVFLDCDIIMHTKVFHSMLSLRRVLLVLWEFIFCVYLFCDLLGGQCAGRHILSCLKKKKKRKIVFVSAVKHMCTIVRSPNLNLHS